MIKSLTWLKYAQGLDVEWEQANLEGRQVEQYKEECQSIAKKAMAEDMYASAKAMEKKLLSAPVKADFGYVEPSEWDQIQKAKPAGKAPNYPLPSREKYLERLKGAWVGRIAGCLLGKPLEGLYARERIWPLLKGSGNYPMDRYLFKADLTEEQFESIPGHAKGWLGDIIEGAAPRDDDTDYTVFALKLVETYGRDFTPDQVLEGWLRWIPVFSTCTAERVAYRNALLGMLPPETAAYENPFREFIGAQIRGDFFGYINPGKPNKAAEMAFRDASISHVKNGIYGEMFIAAMLAAAACLGDAEAVIRAGLDEIPEKSRLFEDVGQVLAWHKAGLGAEEIIQKIHARFNDRNAFDWCYTNSNAMIVAMALLCGGNDVGRSICLAVQAGFDTDCNGATAGSIVGMMTGFSAIDPKWYTPFQCKVATSIQDFSVADVKSLAERTLALAEI
jgi:ADP-ribosylglycohydrolase